MAILRQGLNRSQVNKLAGVLDFYYWKGIPVVRKWPQYHNFVPSPRTQESNAAFKASREILKALGADIVAAYGQTYIGKKRAWVDAFTRRFMHAWKILGVVPPVVTTLEKEYTASGLEITFTGTNETPLTGHLHQGQNPEQFETERCRGIMKKEPDEPRLPEVWENVEDEPETEKTVNNIGVTGLSRGWKDRTRVGKPLQTIAEQTWAALQAWYWSGGGYSNVTNLLLSATGNGYPSFTVTISAEWNKIRVDFSDWYDVYPTTDPERLTIHFTNTRPIKAGHVVIGDMDDESHSCAGSPLEISIDVKPAWKGQSTVDMYILADCYTPYYPPHTNWQGGFAILPYDPGTGFISLSKPAGEAGRKWTIPTGLVTPATEINSYIDFTTAAGLLIPPAPLRISTIPTKLP